MNKISFIIEFDEVSKTQEEQLTEFIENTGIKFHVFESDNDLKKYKKYKEVIDKARECIKNFLCTEDYINVNGIGIANNYKELLEILKGDSNE